MSQNVKKLATTLMEKYMGFKKTVAAIEKGGSAENPEAVAASIGRKKYGKAKFQKAAAAGKKLGEGEMDEGVVDQLRAMNYDRLAKRTGKQADKHFNDTTDMGLDWASDERIDRDEEWGQLYDKSRNRKAKAQQLRQKPVKEAAKPDFLDLDKDGNKKEPMKKAAKDAKKLKESDERPYVCVHAKKGKCEVKGTSSYDAAKKAAAKWGLKSTAGIDAHLADTPMSTSQIGEAREFKTKDDFDAKAKVGDYYHTKAGNKVTKTKGGIKHERMHSKEKDEVDESVIQEKAKSKAQQKFMGMVYATKKGEKAPSKSVAKVAKGMTTKAAKEFAKTKTKGLPQHVKESRKMNESHDIRKHPIYTTQEAWDHYANELAEQEMADMAAEALMQEEPVMDSMYELDEIARLAGLPQKEAKCMECGMEESKCGCDHGDMDEVMLGEEGMEEGNDFTKARLDAIKAGKDSFIVGGKTYKVTGDTSDEKSQVEESVTLNISATDEDVVAMVQKLAGLPVVAVATNPSAGGCGEELEEDGVKARDIEYTNTPREETAAPEAAYPGGTDLNRPKKMYKKEYPGDNPMAVKEEALWKSYESMIKSIKE